MRSTKLEYSEKKQLNLQNVDKEQRPFTGNIFFSKLDQSRSVDRKVDKDANLFWRSYQQIQYLRYGLCLASIYQKHVFSQRDNLVFFLKSIAVQSFFSFEELATEGGYLITERAKAARNRVKPVRGETYRSKMTRRRKQWR